jgi:SAM-dependent methyltransferase
MESAHSLAQADATSLVDTERLERAVVEVYRGVASDPAAVRHFEVGRGVALRAGYPAELLDAIPREALESFAGVGYHLDLARLRAGDRVLDLGSGSGTDVFCAAALVGDAGSVVGVDFTDLQVAKAERARDSLGMAHVSFAIAPIDRLPFQDASFDVVISNGVINLSPAKQRVFSEAARVLRPGGRLALADIVSHKPLKERTRRNVDLWAACIAGAIPRPAYLRAIEAAGFTVGAVRVNDYEFTSERALEACSTYSVQSISIAARLEA